MNGEYSDRYSDLLLTGDPAVVGGETMFATGAEFCEEVESDRAAKRPLSTVMPWPVGKPTGGDIALLLVRL